MSGPVTQEDLDFDRAHIWHPYTSLTKPLKVYPVERAEGCIITLSDGTKLVDGMASWWCVQHGYNNPILNKAATDQLSKMSHIMFGGLAHKPSIELCKKLVELTPAGLECVLLADSGSISIDVGLKMALQYQNSKGRKDKSKFLTIRHGYHGDAFGGLSVSDTTNSMHHIFQGFLPKNIFCKAPETRFDNQDPNVEQIVEEIDVKPFKEIIEKRHEEIAGFILEPIVQGAGGLRVSHPYFLKRASEICKKYDVLLILDEVATGLGRTGKLFAFEHANIVPDILCLGKSLTGGYLTLSATITSREIGNEISDGPAGCFMHGQTYMGNPLACAVGNANLGIIMEGKWKNQVKQIETQLLEELGPLKDHPKVADIRILGAIGIVQLKENVNVEEIQKKFVAAGAWIRPFRNLVYIYPQYTTKPEELTVLTNAIKSSI